MQRSRRLRSPALFVLWAAVLFAIAGPAAAQEIPGNLKTAITEALADVCGPVVREGVSFKEAMTAADPKFEDVSASGTEQGLHKIDVSTWITVSQVDERKVSCTLLVGTKRSLRPSIFLHVMETWNCSPRTVSEPEAGRTTVQCPDSQIQAVFAFKGKDDVILGFNFNLLPGSEPPGKKKPD